MKIRKKAFTLVELIVALTILIFLSAIWYIKYSDYISWSRDTARYSKLNKISDLLKSYKLKKALPAPIDFVEIKSLWKVIWYQWYAWPDVLEKIHYWWKWKDPDDDKYFTYYITSDRKFFELMWFYENEDSLKFSNFSKKTYAWDIDYTNRYPYVVWTKIGILTTNDNKPVQEVNTYINNWYVDLSWVDKNTLFKAYITNDRIYNFSWSILSWKLYTIANISHYWPPRNCPNWYIWVWWDKDFNQAWFCVAKYEMTYTQLDSPWNPTNTNNYNTYDYDSSKRIASRVDYPITNITQKEAIEACRKLWKWYHLITNNEWMTIARQIEFEKDNWKNKLSWFWDGTYGDTLYNWNSTDSFMSRWCSDNTWPNDKVTKTWGWISTCFHKRKNTLFNWEIIWDFAWNVAEHVNKANTKSWSWFNNWRTQFYKSDWSSPNNTWEEFQDLDASIRPMYWPLIWKSWSNWEWLIYDFNGNQNNVFVRWWSYGDWYSAWIYTLNINMKWKDNSDWVAFKDDLVWFRCAR